MVKIQIKNERGISLHVDTIRKRTHELGRVARKKLYVNKINRGKWIKFGKEILEKPVDFWKNILWSDGSDGQVMIWRTVREEFHRKSSIPTIKQVAGSVMIWSCFIHQRVGKLYVSSTDFTLEIFCGQPSIDAFTLGQQCIFMYVIMIVNIPQDELKRRRIETLVWPSYFPDFNPKENLWDELERTVKKYDRTGTSINRGME